MSNMQALGYFMDYCNHHAGEDGITNSSFQSGINEILNSYEGRFEDCEDALDVLRVLGRRI